MPFGFGVGDARQTLLTSALLMLASSVPFGFGVGDARDHGISPGWREFPVSSVPFGFGVGDAGLTFRNCNRRGRRGLQCLSALASGTPGQAACRCAMDRSSVPFGFGVGDALHGGFGHIGTPRSSVPFGFGVGDAIQIRSAHILRCLSSVPFGFGVGDARRPARSRTKSTMPRLQCLTALASGTPNILELNLNCTVGLQCLTALASGTPPGVQLGCQWLSESSVPYGFGVGDAACTDRQRGA